MKNTILVLMEKENAKTRKTFCTSLRLLSGLHPPSQIAPTHI